MSDQPIPMDRRTLQNVYGACQDVVEHPDDSASVTITADIWRRLKRVGLEVRR